MMLYSWIVLNVKYFIFMVALSAVPTIDPGDTYSFQHGNEQHIPSSSKTIEQVKHVQTTTCTEGETHQVEYYADTEYHRGLLSPQCGEYITD